MTAKERARKDINDRLFIKKAESMMKKYPTSEKYLQSLKGKRVNDGIGRLSEIDPENDTDKRIYTNQYNMIKNRLHELKPESKKDSDSGVGNWVTINGEHVLLGGK